MCVVTGPRAYLGGEFHCVFDLRWKISVPAEANRLGIQTASAAHFSHPRARQPPEQVRLNLCSWNPRANVTIEAVQIVAIDMSVERMIAGNDDRRCESIYPVFAAMNAEAHSIEAARDVAPVAGADKALLAEREFLPANLQVQ